MIKNFLKETSSNDEFNMRERIVCQDGFSMSIQASRLHYCSPRESLINGNYDSVEIGFPNEYEFDIFESIKLMKILKPKSFAINFVCPYIGTKLHKLCQKLNLLDAETTPGFRGMAKSVSIRKPTMYNPNISQKRLSQLYLESMEYVKGIKPIPKQYLIDAPGVNSPRGIYNSNEAKIISQMGEYRD